MIKAGLSCQPRSWLDSIAIAMSAICAIHCLITPVLIVALPILATSFWVHKDFHLWMMLFVLPTTSAAVYMGCKTHKDKYVLGLSILGLSLLAAVTGYEVLFHSGAGGAAHCPHCAAKEKGELIASTSMINVLGGMFLASAHIRNFLLCRKAKCEHDH